jgi:elongation factor Ts
VLVQLDNADPDIAQEVATQVAAMRPLYVTREQVPDDVLAGERRIAEQITRDEGKPEQAIPKIVEGRLNAFLKEIVLSEQPSVRDEHKKKPVGQLLADRGASVRQFARFQVGQAD